jgi:indolepyruvate ferredoxin oxidoreductase beta subunit
MAQPPITILLCALGGEGGGVLSQWLYDTAVHAGHAAQATSIPGVAQRTGATTYYVEIARNACAGEAPLFSLSPVPGAVDLLVSSELLETVRQIGNGMASAERTTVLSSSARALTVAEKMVPGDGRVDDAALLAVLQRHAQRAEVLDFGALARDAGTAISAVLLGAIAASGMLPFARADYEATIRRSGRGVEASLRGFALAHDTLAARAARRAQIDALLQPAPAARSAPELPAAWRERFPPALHDLLALAHARLVDYQDADYAALYAERLARCVAADRSAGHAASREVARWLALWMAFDDIVRVAYLKLRAARQQRVRVEVGARDDEIVKTFEHFKPGVPEVAALLPAALARRLSAWDERRRARGRPAWALPLTLGSHRIGGTLALRLLASLKGQRRRGARYAVEQALIERWLTAVELGLAEDAVLGAELAACGRLIKGYGSTNERGKERLLHIVDHLAGAHTPAAQRAQAVHEVREAALADDTGRTFDARLQAHGAPARPVREQPVRWYKRRPANS